MAGAPAALQIVGPKWGDAQLLKDVEVLDAILNPKNGETALKAGQSKL
jgi:Asp-tRNA(Asn)/Glu-tRNA(Gln) amidotransferase A subunit family amidase